MVYDLSTMPRYIIERIVPGLTPEGLQTAGKKSNEVLDGLPAVKWIRSFVCSGAERIYCEYEAPNPEAIMEHSRRSGIPANRISEIDREIVPDMFR